jgi:hypothetical protein
MPKRSPRRKASPFIEHAELERMHPHEFLLAVMRCKHVLINGVKYEPTLAQRMSAAGRLSAVLEGRTVPEKDDDF